ncbi:general transcription factor II-I repeat domain-containing protein 2A [Trichonephila clavipes]|nr:general transcription factor II-I repeat domain-containing protein 2A [Trichonephila clavipes]
MINKGDKVVCVLCSGTVVCRTSSVKRHFETNRKSFVRKANQSKELIASAIKDKKINSRRLSLNISKIVTRVANYSAANAIARNGKPFPRGRVFEGSLVGMRSLVGSFLMI